MAERVVNSAIEFAYASYDIEADFKKELEKYFIYQNIVVVDANFDFGLLYDKLERSTKCNFKRVKSIDQIDNFENVDCMIVVNCCQIDKIKAICKRNSIPYIISLTKVCDISNFKNCYFENIKEIKSCNYPLGIMFDLNSVFNKNQFVSLAILEVSSVCFDITQKRLENLFFNNQIDYEYLETEKNILKELEKILEKRNENIEKFAKKIADLYLFYVITCVKDGFTMLDNLTILYKIANKKNVIEAKYLFRLIVSSLEKNFVEHYNAGLKDAIDYNAHERYLNAFGLSFDFKPLMLAETKINYLLKEFKEKLLEYILLNINFDKNIKAILAEIDIDFLYEMIFKFKHQTLTNYICLEPDIFKTPNFLKIMYQLGLLNFKI